MVAVDADHHIGKQADIFGGFVPFGWQGVEIGEGLILGQLRIVDQCALARELTRMLNMVVILQLGIAVETGVNPRQVIALAIVLKDQFPVRFDSGETGRVTIGTNSFYYRIP